MNLIRTIIVGSLAAFALAGAAQARTLPGMTWQPAVPDVSGSTNSIYPLAFLPSTLADGTTLTNFAVEFNPGTIGPYSVLTQQGGGIGVVYAWGGVDSDGNYSGNALEVDNIQNAPLNLSLANDGNLLRLEFDFGSTSKCQGGASLLVNGLAYTSSDCGSAQFAFYNSSSGNDFVVCTAANANASGNGCAGNVSSLGDWKLQGSTTNDAPEIDPNSATTALMLLLGTLVVLRSGRQTKPHTL